LVRCFDNTRLGKPGEVGITLETLERKSHLPDQVVFRLSRGGCCRGVSNREAIADAAKIASGAIPDLQKEAGGEEKMLASGKIVGFVPTKDYDKARAFYEGNLGFEFISLDQYALVMSVGGHKIRIAKVPNFIPLQGTILGWEVENIEAVVTWLRDRGVVLEKYPFVQDRELGIWTTPSGDKVAWFKDPDGNILSVSQHG